MRGYLYYWLHHHHYKVIEKLQKTEVTNMTKKMNKKLRTVITVLIVLALITGTGTALIVNTIPAVKMHMATTTLAESDVVVTDIVPLGNKLLRSVEVTLNNTDVNPHTVTLNVDVYGTGVDPIGTGILTNQVIGAGVTDTFTVTMGVKPDMKDVVSIDVVVRELL